MGIWKVGWRAKCQVRREGPDMKVGRLSVGGDVEGVLLNNLG
jgi:hypothetical protein